MTSFLQNQKSKLILILFLAFAIRLAGISSRPIWYDEAFSILLSEKGPSAILHGTLASDSDSSAAEEHPPVYYFMLWGWMQVFGNSLIAARMLSIILSLGIILYTYLIAKHLFDPPTALAAAFVTAILPFQIHYGQEIRMYVLLTFWLCLTTLAFLKRQWILFSVAAALAQYTHNLAAFYLIPLALTPIFQKDWKTLRSLTLAGFASIILYLPWLIHLPAQLSKVTSGFWIERPGVEKLFTLILIYVPHLPLPDGLLLPGLLLATLSITLATYQTFRTAKNNFPEARKGLWLGYLSFVPSLLLWLVSQISALYVERALLPSHAIFCIWLAWACTKTKLPRAIQALILFFIVAASIVGLYQHVAYKSFPYGPYKALNESIQKRLQEGDIIIHANKNTLLPSAYYNPEISQDYIADPAGSGTDTLAIATQEILGLVAKQSIENATSKAGRVWLIVFQRHIDRYIELGYESHPHLIYLQSNFALEGVEQWDDLRVYIFTRQENK
ncbi:MAG: glycosyltransferase family 39 protein [Chloroflexi bacterium]|nr:glycosyltransferase family 39 protein [Chloroflexota bacterium]